MLNVMRFQKRMVAEFTVTIFFELFKLRLVGVLLSFFESVKSIINFNAHAHENKILFPASLLRNFLI